MSDGRHWFHPQHGAGFDFSRCVMCSATGCTRRDVDCGPSSSETFISCPTCGHVWSWIDEWGTFAGGRAWYGTQKKEEAE